jgi:hypothetical protein
LARLCHLRAFIDRRVEKCKGSGDYTAVWNVQKPAKVLKFYDVFLFIIFYQHVSASSPAILRVMFSIQEYSCSQTCYSYCVILNMYNFGLKFSLLNNGIKHYGMRMDNYKISGI